jgi:hypothetical protein
VLHESFTFLTLRHDRQFLKKKALHTIVSILLIANLLFSQVGLNFFHSRDTEQHEAFAGIEQAQSTVHNHSEHCKVCSLDILFNLLIQPTTPLRVLRLKTSPIVILSVDANRIPVSFAQDRAPPVFL